VIVAGFMAIPSIIIMDSLPSMVAILRGIHCMTRSFMPWS
jgi:hypothetical protein